MLINYKTMFGSKPNEYSIPMAEKDHPEIDNSELLDNLGNKQYQSLIGALQWIFTLGRFDIHLLCPVSVLHHGKDILTALNEFMVI
jgi:hypothetical protein